MIDGILNFILRYVRREATLIGSNDVNMAKYECLIQKSEIYSMVPFYGPSLHERGILSGCKPCSYYFQIEKQVLLYGCQIFPNLEVRMSSFAMMRVG